MNKTPKIKWKVGEKPTGMYRAFQSREWPTACYVVGDRYAFSISCEDEYRPADVKSGKHAE